MIISTLVTPPQDIKLKTGGKLHKRNKKEKYKEKEDLTFHFLFNFFLKNLLSKNSYVHEITTKLLYTKSKTSISDFFSPLPSTNKN
jgi:hypothetical protein